MFGLAIGGASFLNLLMPLAFRSHVDGCAVVVQIMQGLIQVNILYKKRYLNLFFI